MNILIEGVLITALSLFPNAKTPAERLVSPSDDTVSAEFLEFLGEWETDDGQWIDPAQVERMVKGKGDD